MTAPQITKALYNALKPYAGDYQIINLVNASRNGTADLHMVFRGRYVYLEVKGDGDTIKPLQALNFERYQRAGAYCKYLRNKRDINNLIRELKTWY